MMTPEERRKLTEDPESIRRMIQSVLQDPNARLLLLKETCGCGDIRYYGDMCLHCSKCISCCKCQSIKTP